MDFHPDCNSHHVCGPTLLLILNGCDDLIPYQRDVNVAPLMDLAIPADMDLSQWTNQHAAVQSYEGFNVTTNVERFSSIEAASARFQRECGYASNPVIYDGEDDNRTCISSVKTSRADPAGLCGSLGYYRSSVILQKSDVVIEIFERSPDRNSTQKDVVIAQIASEIYKAMDK